MAVFKVGMHVWVYVKNNNISATTILLSAEARSTRPPRQGLRQHSQLATTLECTTCRQRVFSSLPTGLVALLLFPVCATPSRGVRTSSAGARCSFDAVRRSRTRRSGCLPSLLRRLREISSLGGQQGQSTRSMRRPPPAVAAGGWARFYRLSKTACSENPLWNLHP